MYDDIRGEALETYCHVCCHAGLQSQRVQPTGPGGQLDEVTCMPVCLRICGARREARPIHMTHALPDSTQMKAELRTRCGEMHLMQHAAVCPISRCSGNHRNDETVATCAADRWQLPAVRFDETKAFDSHVAGLK